jgi:hypothetical protein
MNEKNKYEINWQANIAEIGKRAEEAIEALDQQDNDSLRDHLLEIHSMIYPNASECGQRQGGSLK